MEIKREQLTFCFLKYTREEIVTCTLDFLNSQSVERCQWKADAHATLM